MKPFFCAVFVFIAFVSFVPGAHAETRVVVQPFYGPYADQVRKEVISTLSKQRELNVVSSGQVDRSASRLGVDARSREGRLKVAQSLHVAAWIEGIVQHVGSQLRLTVIAYEGKSNERIARYVITRKKAAQLDTGVRMDLWPKTRDALLGAEAPGGSGGDDANDEIAASDNEESSPDESEETPPSRSAPVASTRSAAKDGAPSMALGAAPSIASARWSVSAAGAAPSENLPAAIIVEGNAGTLTRKLTFSDVQTQTLGDYSLPIAPALNLEARYFPGAHFSAGPASWFGLDVRVGLAFPAASKTRDGSKFSASVANYSAGARLRVPLGEHEVSVLGAYSIDRFEFSDSKDKPAPTPDTDYRAVKMGAEGVYHTTDRLSLGARGAFLLVLSAGEIGEKEFFSRLSGNGLDFGLFGYYALNARLDLTLDLALKRYFFSFNPEPGDPIVAGGATDTTFNAAVGVRFRR